MKTSKCFIWIVGLLWSCLGSGLMAQQVSPLPTPADPAVEAAHAAAKAQGKTTPLVQPTQTSPAASTPSPAAARPQAVSAVPTQPKSVVKETGPVDVHSEFDRSAERRGTMAVPAVKEQEVAAVSTEAKPDPLKPVFKDTGNPTADAQRYHDALMAYYKTNPPTDEETKLKLKLAEELKTIDAQNAIDQK